MRPSPDQNGPPVAIRLGAPRGVGPWAIVVGLVAVVSLGLLGRLVPAPAAELPAAPTVMASPEPGAQLGSPFADALYLQTTEIAVRGTAPGGIQQVDIRVVVGGLPIGEARIDVDATGRFDGLVSIIPPIARSVGVLEVRDPGSSGRLLTEVSFAVEAGALILPREPSTLRGEAGSIMVVDVLVYGPLREIRGLLTSVDGTLIATGSTLVGLPRGAGAGPRTIGMSIEIPRTRLPDRVRLHILAFDQAGAEVEHIDANVALSSG